MEKRLLGTIAWRNLIQRRGRAALVGSSVVLAVAAFVAVTSTVSTIVSAFDEYVTEIAGDADVFVTPIGAQDAQLPPETLDQVLALPDVVAAGGGIVFPTALDAGEERVGLEQGNRTLLVTGSTEALVQIRPLELASGRLFAADGEVVLPATIADELGVEPGGTVEAASAQGPATLTVVGTTADGTDLMRSAHTSVGTAAALAGTDVPNFVAVDLAPGVDTDSWIEQHRDSVGLGVAVDDVSTAVRPLKTAVGQLGGAFAAMSLVVFCVAAFLIHLTLSVAVTERVRLFGILKALGLPRRSVTRTVILESLALGGVATVLGIVVGIGLATGLLSLVTRFFGSDVPSLSVSPLGVLGALVLGVGTTGLAAILPARRAGTLDPVAAIAGRHETREAPGWLRVAAAGAVVGSLVMGLSLRGSVAAGASSMVLLAGAVLLAPVLVPVLASVLSRVLKVIRPGIGEVAVLHLVKERSRSGYTLSLIMVVLAMTLAAGASYLSLGRAFDRQVDQELGADVVLTAASTFEEPFITQVREQPDVRAVAPLATGATRARTDAADERVDVRFVDPATYFEVAGIPLNRDSPANATDALDDGGVIIAGEVARSLGVRAGDQVELDTNAGPREFAVAGVFDAFLFGSRSMVIVGWSTGVEQFGLASPTELHVAGRPGVDAEALVATLETGLAGPTTFIAETGSALRGSLRSQFEGFFGLTWVIILISALVSVLGLTNTLAISVLQRFREIGILRSIGLTGRHVRAITTIESLSLGMVGLVLAVPLGLALSMLAVEGNLGTTVDLSYVFPWGWLPVTAVLAAFVAAAAAVIPARRSARLDIVEALRFE